MEMTFIRTSQPSKATILTWLSLAEMKQHLRIIGTAQDSVIESCIVDAFSMLDGPGGRYQRAILGVQEYVLTLDAFPSDNKIDLAYPPIIAVTAIEYIDANDATQTLAGSAYTVLNRRVISIVSRLSDTWPTTASRPDAVTVTFTAGWTASEIPPRIMRACKLLAAHFFENREATIIESRTTTTAHEIPLGIRDIIALDRVPNRYY